MAQQKPGMITRTIMAIVIASLALWGAVVWAARFPIEDFNASSVSGVIASFTMERYTTAAILAAIMLFLGHQFAYGPNPLISIIMAGILAMILIIPATLMLGITGATDDLSASAASNLVAYVALIAASLHSLGVLPPLLPPSAKRTSTDNDRPAP